MSEYGVKMKQLTISYEPVVPTQALVKSTTPDGSRAAASLSSRQKTAAAVFGVVAFALRLWGSSPLSWAQPRPFTTACTTRDTA